MLSAENSVISCCDALTVQVLPSVTGAHTATVASWKYCLAKSIWEDLKDKVVLDFGCGEGEDAVEVARKSARRVIGLDLRESVLSEAKKRAVAAGVSDKCEFTTRTDEKVDVILSVDAFEHFKRPGDSLEDNAKPGAR